MDFYVQVLVPNAENIDDYYTLSQTGNYESASGSSFDSGTTYYIKVCYILTSDEEIDPDKTYYKKTYSAILSSNLQEDNLYLYYEKRGSEYEETWDDELVANKTYYQEAYVAVAQPIQENLENYYEMFYDTTYTDNNISTGNLDQDPEIIDIINVETFIDQSNYYEQVSNPSNNNINNYYEYYNNYILTNDTEVEDEKNYYSKNGNQYEIVTVINNNNPSENNLYEYIDYIKTTDTEVNLNKIYYIYVGPGDTSVSTEDPLDNYYNIQQIDTSLENLEQTVLNLLSANDAMIFKGTIGSIDANPTITTLPAVHEAGWTYKIITSGVYISESCEVGDMIICVKDGEVANNADWAIVQTNIDGAVIGPTGSVIGHVPIFNSLNGKEIADSGYTIATSVPSGAVFTDTTYAFLGGNGSFSVTPSNGSTETISIGKPPVATKAETVDVTDTTPTSARSYYPVYVTGRSNDQVLRANADLYYYDAGTYSYLNVGSSSTQGGLTLHCNNGNYANIAPATLSAVRTFTLPNKTGTIALTSDLTSKAPLESPALTGVPTAPTANLNTNTTQIATTEFVNNQINNLDVSAITGTTNQTITSISEVDGKISAVYSDISITESQISDFGNYAPISAIKTYESFPESWNDVATNEYVFQDFLDEIDSSEEAQEGHSFLGRISCSDTATGNIIVEILQGTETLNKIIHVILYADSLIPAKQEFIYHSVDGSNSGWF